LSGLKGTSVQVELEKVTIVIPRLKQLIVSKFEGWDQGLRRSN